MKTLFYNANIYTMDVYNTRVNAMLVEDGTIITTGNYENLLSDIKGEYTEVNLNGRTMLPGFIDTHIHMLYSTVSKKSVDLTSCNSVDEVIQTGKDFVANTSPFRGWITGRGWDQGKFPDQAFVTKKDLDQVSTSVPIVFERVCGHTVTVNSLGLKKILDLPESKDLKRFIDEDTGILRESATMLRNLTVKDFTVAEIKNLLLEGQNDVAKKGIVGVHSADFIGGVNESQWEDVVEAYRQLDEENKLITRVYQQSMFVDKENVYSYLDSKYNTGTGTDFFKIGPLKLLQDGSLGGRTAAMIDPYDDDPSTKGFTIYSIEDLYKICEIAYKKNMQIAIHGIGDEAAKEIAEIYASLNEKYGGENRRNGLVHAQFLNPQILEILKKEQINCYVQPIFIDDDMRLAEQRVGSQRIKYSYIWKTLVDNNIPTSGGSDAPISTFDVIAGLHTAINRQNLLRQPEEGWYPDEKLSVEEAIRLYTTSAAYASFEEDIKGSLEPGKFADFVLLDCNIFEIDPKNILDINIVATYLGGKEIYRA